MVIYQENLSCMALMKRGGPRSGRSRHIDIRPFRVAEKVADGADVIEHLTTGLMYTNALTKPVQGAQFERRGVDLSTGNDHRDMSAASAFSQIEKIQKMFEALFCSTRGVLCADNRVRSRCCRSYFLACGIMPP